MHGLVDGKDVTAKEESFKTVKDEPNEYVLDSGVRVRVKLSVAKIGRQVDENGEYMENRYGDPAVLVRYALEIVTSLEPSNAEQ
jgi:hypothetical protein